MAAQVMWMTMKDVTLPDSLIQTVFGTEGTGPSPCKTLSSSQAGRLVEYKVCFLVPMYLHAAEESGWKISSDLA